MADLTIRDLEKTDRLDWGRLWSDYLTFYQTSLPLPMFDLAFERLMSPDQNEFQGLIAQLDDQPVGFAHTLAHRHGWHEERVVYLQDLFVSPLARKGGVGRALVEHVYRRADEAGTPKVYWLTAKDNSKARMLYDQVASDSGFMVYKR